MLIKMKSDVSGLRDGAPWPARGETLDVPDAEATDLLNAGIAVAGEAPPVVETASLSK